MKPPLVEQVLKDYDSLEPGEADAWNPVASKWQLGYRLNLFYGLSRALERSGVAIADLRVLDLGCGNGRSTRMYLDMGLHPEQLRALDLRAGTLALARKLHPAIAWELHDGGDLPSGHDWVSATVVFSSVATGEARREIAQKIMGSLPAGGHVFYYDSRVVRDWLGGEAIEPERLFAGCSLVWKLRIGRYACLPLTDRLEGFRRYGLGGSDSAPSLRECLREMIRPFDEILLFRKG